MSSISELKEAVHTKTLTLVLLTIATGGIYLIMWVYRNEKKIESITETKLPGDLFTIWMAVCLGLSSTISGTGESAFDLLAGVLSVAYVVLYIVWSFKARKALKNYALNQHKIDLKMNAFYTFIFTVFYINYSINDLPNVKQKHDILSGSGAQTI